MKKNDYVALNEKKSSVNHSSHTVLDPLFQYFAHKMLLLKWGQLQVVVTLKKSSRPSVNGPPYLPLPRSSLEGASSSQ